MAPQSDHFDGRRFFNPNGPPLPPLSAAPRMLLERRTRWPARVDEPPRRLPALDGAGAIVTFIGHATLLIQTAAGNFLALLPIGAYEPRWFMQSVHMNPPEAVQAHVDLGASRSIGMHFGTFQLTTEGIDAPLRALGQARDARAIPSSRFSTLGFGESARVSGRGITSPW